MKFGFFDDSQREYVITNPKTPYPWINYLGTENFFSLISNTAASGQLSATDYSAKPAHYCTPYSLMSLSVCP